MEKVLRIFDDHATADHATRADNIQLTCLQRFEAFMEIMSPYYEAAGGLQRICRIDDLKQRQFRDDWGLRLQSLRKSEGDR